MAVKIYIVWGTFWMETRLGLMCICARTFAKIWQHADEEHKEQDPKTRRQENLVALMECSRECFVYVKARVCLCLNTCLCLQDKECVC